MEAKAVTRYVRISPRKARLVTELIKGKPVEEALTILRFVPKKAARLVDKTLRSALANAEQNPNIDVDICGWGAHNETLAGSGYGTRQ